MKCWLLAIVEFVYAQHAFKEGYQFKIDQSYMEPIIGKN
jgi:hypothetical protein